MSTSVHPQDIRPGSIPPVSNASGPVRRQVEPIARRAERRLAGETRDPVAILATLRARMRAALARGDTQAEAQAASRLARALFESDSHLDEAVASGRRAIVLRPEDDGLRRSVAQALRTLGEPGLAAALIRPVVDSACARASREAKAAEDAVEGLLTIGDLLLRAGDIEGALESFRYVAVVAPERPDGQERVAMARGVAPSMIPAEVAARAYIGAAKKHQIAGDDARALEMLARAFETDPSSPLAANVLADALEEIGRVDAADAVRAEHARALGPKLEAAAVVHAARREKARMRNDRAAVIASVLDELVDLAIHTEPSAREGAHARIDAALEEIPEIANARRRVSALLSTGRAALEGWRAVAAAAIASPATRAQAHAEIVARDLSDEPSLAALREHARQSRDATLVVDALIRGLRNAAPGVDPQVFAARAAELAGWADEQLDDASLAAWAWRRHLAVAPDDKHAQGELGRLAGRLAEAEERLAAADREGSIEARRGRLRLLLGVPDREGEIVEDIAAILAAVPNDPVALSALDRATRRLGGEDLRRATELRESAGPESTRGGARSDRIEAALRRGDVAAALGLATSDGSPESAPIVIALALRLGGPGELAIGLARAAVAMRPRAPYLAAAARAARASGNIESARRFAEEAMADGPRELRGAAELAELASSHPGALPLEAASAALERALGGIGARGRWALSLAAVAEATKETPIAAAWTRRAWSLRPGDLEVARLWILRAVAVGDPELIAEVVNTTVMLVTSLAPIAEAIATALRALFADDARIGESVARVLLGLGAARMSSIRSAIIGAATASPSLLVATDERWLASGAPAIERANVLLSIAETARNAGDFSRAADAAGRALHEPELESAVESRALALLGSLAGRALGPDAELVTASALVDRKSADARRAVDASPRARISAELEVTLRETADALRALGRDLWDLADDRDAALRAWLAGAKLLGEEGVDRLESDIAHFGGEDAARDALFELTRRDDMASESAGSNARRVRADAFRLRAFERVLTHPPAWLEPMSLAREAAARAADAGAILPEIEALAIRNGRTDMLDEVYGIAAGRAAGRFGARGVHYRAARVLGRLGRGDEALSHAVRAFSAVPSEGAMLMMLERLARGSSRPDVAVSALVEAAEQADDPAKKATWLDRAASIAGGEATLPEERFDLLLRLFLTAPTARTAEGLVLATRGAIAADPSSRETWMQRFLRAHRRVEASLKPSERLSVLAVVVRAAGELDGLDRAISLLTKSAEGSSSSELGPLRSVAEEIAARDPETTRSWLDREPGGGTLRAHLAWGAGDPDRALELLAEHATTDHELAGAIAPELEFLEKWAPSARDKRAIARAWERFGKHQGPAGDLEAARALDEAGQTDEAARMLVDAWRNRETASPEVVRQILTLGRAILPHAGADAALIEMLEADLQANPEGEAREMIVRWREVAELRTTRLGDRLGALGALVEGGRLAPADDELWNEIAELAESIGAHDRLAAALAQRLQRARPDKRVTLLRKLARVLEHDLGRDDEAAERWAELVRLLPLDAEAADALERIAERRGDTAELLDLLRARAARLPVGHAERTRALRRIARELGAVQGRRGEVLSALREVHQQNPGDMEVAVQLSHLARSAGDLGTAAEALMRAFRSATRDGARVHLAIEAARVLLELHDHDTASRLLHEAAGVNLEGEPRALDLVRLQLEVAIARSDAREEAMARIRLAELDVQSPPDRRAAHFAAAAKSLLSMGETVRAKDLAWKAARALPGDVGIAAQLAELEFAGATRRQPAEGDGELLGLLGQVEHSAAASADALAVIAFARAELLDLARGAGAGYQDLNAWPEEVKNKALVQLALAERLAAEWSFGQAAIAYERAFAGDLRGLRALGPAALQAADAAARSDDAMRARTFLDLAARDPACRIDARKRAVELARAIGDDDAALRALERLAAEATGNARAQALADQARLLESKDTEAASEAMRLALAAAEEGTPLHEELSRERAELDSQRASRSLPPAPPPSLRDSGITSNRAGGSFDRSLSAMLSGTAPAEPAPPAAWIGPQSDSEPPPSSKPARAVSTQRLDAVVAAPPESPPTTDPTETKEELLSEHPRLTMVGEAPGVAYRPRSMPALPRPVASTAQDLAALDKIALDPASPAAERVRALKTLGDAAREGGKTDEAVRHFISALELGDIAAGDQAAELLGTLAHRASDLLLVRRRQVFLAPGDRLLLDGLHAAALGARDLVFARAIDHVRRAFDRSAGPVPPPALDLQLDRPDLVLPLIERRANAVAAESLRIAWDNASLLFRREQSALGRGTERVTGALPIGRVVAAASRLLGTQRTPVYVRQRAGRDVEVVLLSPPTVMLGGDCREETVETRYVLGVGLLAANPAHCLLLAQSEAGARQTWQALLSAFGPPEHGRGVAPEVGRLGAALWQSIPRAAQRRLGELLAQQPPIFETALEGARQVARRGGLYLSGDLTAAVRSTLAEVNELEAVTGENPDLALVCEHHPRVADLFRLATSPEFAEARWRGSTAPHPGSTSGGVPAAR